MLPPDKGEKEIAVDRVRKATQELWELGLYPSIAWPDSTIYQTIYADKPKVDVSERITY